MAGLLVAIGIMGILMSVAMPAWRTYAKREKEAELLFRGQQYMRAVDLYQRRFPRRLPHRSRSARGGALPSAARTGTR